MRSTRPLPGNPWPHDMVLTIVDDAQSLLDLLWVREAWKLDLDDAARAGEDLPPRLSDAPEPVRSSEREAMPIAEWQDAWPALWRDCLLHTASPFDNSAFERLESLKPGSDERERALLELVGPTWSHRFGRDAFTDEYQPWQQRLVDGRSVRHLAPVDEQPERRALDTLVLAWRAGLTTIVEIPCRGTFMRIVGRNAILVTAETRADPARYAEALTLFS